MTVQPGRPTLYRPFGAVAPEAPVSSPGRGGMGTNTTGSGATATEATASTTTTATAADDASGLAFIRQVFSDVFGGSLLEFSQKAWEDYNRGKPLEQILAELRQTPEYAARFPGMAALRKAGRPVSEAAYLDLERQYVSLARQFDLPPGFYDSPDDFGRLIGGQVSPAEYQRRLSAWQAYERETRDPLVEQEIRAQLAAMGMAPSDGDFLAVVIDPQRGVGAIEQRLEAGRVGAEARRSGFGALDADEALRLADMGVTRDQAREGFGALSDSRELFTGLPGEEGADSLTRQEQVGAVFAGDRASARRIERQRQRRLGEFTGGGGASLGRGGLSGIGSAG